MSQISRILVASEDPAILVILRREMEAGDYDVRTVENGSGLLEAAREYRPDLIVLEASGTEMHGPTLGRAIRECEQTAEVPVLFITDSACREQVIEAFAAGGCDYIARPFTAQEVLARVQTQLRIRRAEQELHRRKTELQDVNSRLATLCRRDPLTNLLNRRAWEELVIRQHEIQERYGHPYSVIMVDVDHFRAYNDTHGHQAGDDCLCRIADALELVCRRVDYVGRYGEEVFAVLAPETDADRAVKLADRIHRAIWGLAIPHSAGGDAGRVTASLGVAVSDSASWDEVLRRADAAVLVAKRAGRNMVYLDQNAGAQIGSTTPASPLAAVAVENPVEVLIVDDDPTNRAVCRGCLQRTGYRIREAEDGRAALEEIGKHVPDVIIMDVMMPVMDGLECTRTLRADPDTRDIPIIIVSALARTEDILAGLEAGADEYISKPIRSSELTLRVQSMVRLNRERLDLLRSYEQRGRQMRILTRLVEFCRAISLCKTAADILDHTVSTVADVMDCRRVSIMLPDGTGEFLSIATSRGMDEKLARSVCVPLGKSVAGHVFATGQAVVVNTEAEAGIGLNDYDAPYFASIPLVSAPLDAAGRVVGVLNATEKNGGTPFEGRDLEYIELISKVAGTAIHDLRMREARDQASDSIMVALASLAECRDNDTGRHLERVTKFCLMLAEVLRQIDRYRGQIDDDFLYQLERAVPLHDIGKVGIPDDILQYPGKLSEEQMRIMRTHAEVGAGTIESLIARAPGVCFLEMARDIARHHHERWDGKGYPDGLKGTDIPIAARITAVSDVYDALTTKRVYKEAFSHERAVSIIVEGAGSAFDPDVVEAFMAREQMFAALAEAMADHVVSPPCENSREEGPALVAGGQVIHPAT